jgi:transcriptional regulator with XRE-family HTH domain
MPVEIARIVKPGGMPMPQNEAWTIRQKITGVLVRQARQDAGKTLKECGQVLGLSSSTLSAVEHGKRSISLPELEVLAYYLEISLDQLLNGSPKPAHTPLEELPGGEILTLRHRIVGALLRKARLNRDLTQADLAKRAGVSKSQLSQYELGEKPIPLVELEAMAEILDIPFNHFLDAGIGPVGEQQQLEREWERFAELPPAVRAFVLEPSNLSYVNLAMSLSAVPAERLRNIAASLLDITL